MATMAMPMRFQSSLRSFSAFAAASRAAAASSRACFCFADIFCFLAIIPISYRFLRKLLVIFSCAAFLLFQ